MRVAGWFFVILGFALGFVFGFGVPLAEAVPAVASDGAAEVPGWFLARPSWVGPMLLGVMLLTVAGWLHREPDPT